MVWTEGVKHAFRDFDGITEITLFAIHLNVIMQELLKTSSIEDIVRCWP